jgi:hypothetical protein
MIARAPWPSATGADDMDRGDRTARELSRYWDDLVQGDIDRPPPTVLPDEEVTVVRWIDAQRPGPAPHAARERVLRRLEASSNGHRVAVGPLPHARLNGVPNGSAWGADGRVSLPFLARRDQGRALAAGRRALSALATAALFCLTLAVGYLALRQGSDVRDDQPVPVPAVIGAADEAVGEAVSELIVEARFTAEELPNGSPEAIYYRVTLPPGISLHSLLGPFCLMRTTLHTSGVGVELVQSGRYTLQLDAPIRIQRAGSDEAMEEIPAGVEVTLGAGDSAIYPDYAARGTIRNAGTEPVVLIGVALVDADGAGIPTPKLPTGVRTEYLTGTTPSDWRWLPPGPLTVSLWRLALPAGASVGPYEAIGLEALYVERGTLTRYFLPPGESTPRGIPLISPVGRTTSLTAIPPNVRRVIDIGDEPSVLLALSIEPAGIRPETLAP